MRRALLGLVSSILLAATGCELVFGLDEYAQASSEATTGSTGVTTGPDTSTGASTSKGGGASSSSGDGGGGGAEPASSSASGEPTCPCVPAGWKLTQAFPTTAETDLTVCANGVNAARTFADPVVTCDCACNMDVGLDCRLACWPVADCAGNPTILPNSLCAALFPAQSCARQVVRAGLPATEDLCIAEGTVTGSTVANVFDLCTAPPDGTSCTEAGVCDAPASGAIWCIEGPAGEACPAGWPDDHTGVEGGTPVCDDACSCNDDIVCDGTYRLANGGTCIPDGHDVESRLCQNVPSRSNYTAGPELGADDMIGGGCSPVVTRAQGSLVGATETKLCCMAAE